MKNHSNPFFFLLHIIYTLAIYYLVPSLLFIVPPSFQVDVFSIQTNHEVAFDFDLFVIVATFNWSHFNIPVGCRWVYSLWCILVGR